MNSKALQQQRYEEAEYLINHCSVIGIVTVDGIQLELHNWSGWQALTKYEEHHFLLTRSGSRWTIVRCMEHPYTDPDKILQKMRKKKEYGIHL